MGFREGQGEENLKNDGRPPRPTQALRPTSFAQMLRTSQTGETLN